MKRNNRGFTLIELLIVVLIIGVLTSVVLPGYQHSVDKSRFATLLPTTRAIKNAQEGFYLSNGYYADQMQDLDIQAPAGTNYTLKIKGEGSDYNVIQAIHDNLDNVRLASYLDKNSQFAGQLHCEAKVGDERANKLCNTLSMGNKLIATGDNYMGYLLNEEISNEICNSINHFWSTSKEACYQSQAEKCSAIGGTPQTGGVCGYYGTGGNDKTLENEQFCVDHYTEGCKNVVINNGGVCTASYKGCQGAIINDGGVCTGTGYHACSGVIINDGGVCQGTGCLEATIKEGGLCEGNCSRSIIESGGKAVCTSAATCEGVTVKAGGTCEANAFWTCSGDIYGTVIGNAALGTRGLAYFYDGAVCIGNHEQACGALDKKNPSYATFYSGSRCVANVEGSCNANYKPGSCCEGEHCPSTAPSC